MRICVLNVVHGTSKKTGNGFGMLTYAYGDKVEQDRNGNVSKGYATVVKAFAENHVAAAISKLGVPGVYDCETTFKEGVDGSPTVVIVGASPVGPVDLMLTGAPHGKAKADNGTATSKAGA
jgi:hypothetical protein